MTTDPEEPVLPSAEEDGGPDTGSRADAPTIAEDHRVGGAGPEPPGPDTPTVSATPPGPDTPTVAATPPGPDTPTVAEAPADGATIEGAEPTSRVIDNYRLLRRIGAGGMGEVYEAEQTEPVRRRVALKVIRLGMDTEEVVRRFESERQTLAWLDHPAIASVHDAGVTPRGRPYFVMELVRGEPITEFCDGQKLDTRERLELFIEVCGAIQHAHQRGVIHRDLKPSNILVSKVDDEPRPKVIDFGIAKATGESMTDRQMVTTTGQLLGTPEYMSPEQADLAGVDVDTRTDVYALGVVLYEMLTGELPFDSETLRKGGFVEMQRVIKETEPPRPSNRVSTLGGRAAEVASRRTTDVRGLARELRGDLDWILLKALEKERNRRYGSPSEFAADIRRYLNNEAVLATPPSRLYRTRKFVRRHRIAVASAATVLSLLVAFAVTMTVQAGRIARERDRANLEAETARRVSEFLVGLFEVSNPSESLGNRITARQILDEGAVRIRQELAGQPTVQAHLMDTMGQVYRNLALYDKARPLLQEALDILNQELGEKHPDVARPLEHLGTLLVRTGEYDAARPLFERALEIREQQLGPTHRDVASVVSNLGTLSYRTGDYEAARAHYERARDIFRDTSGPEDPQVAKMLTNLAIVARRTRDHEGARALYEQALAILEQAFGPEHPDVAQTLNSLGVLLRSARDYESARPLFERSLAIREKVLEPNHPDIARTLNNLAILHEATGDYARARELHERALGIREGALGPDHPDVAQSLNGLGSVLKSMGDYDAAGPLYERALAIWEQALGKNHSWVAIGYYNLAGLVALRGDRTAAIGLLREAVDRGFAHEAIADDPDLASLRGDPEVEKLVAEVLQRLAED